MSAIPHLREAADLRKEGDRLKRAGMSERVIALVMDFLDAPTYKRAMHLAGALKAVAIAAKCDDYWDEQVSKGYRRELFNITIFHGDEDNLSKLKEKIR